MTGRDGKTIMYFCQDVEIGPRQRVANPLDQRLGGNPAPGVTSLDKEGISEKGDGEERGVFKVDDIEAEAAGRVRVEHKVLVIKVAIAKHKLSLKRDSRMVLRACLSGAPHGNLQIISECHGHVEARGLWQKTRTRWMCVSSSSTLRYTVEA